MRRKERNEEGMKKELNEGKSKEKERMKSDIRNEGNLLLGYSASGNLGRTRDRTEGKNLRQPETVRKLLKKNCSDI